MSLTNPISSFIAEISLGKIIKRSGSLSREEAEQQFQMYLGRPGWSVMTMDLMTALTLRQAGLLIEGSGAKEGSMIHHTEHDQDPWRSKTPHVTPEPVPVMPRRCDHCQAELRVDDEQRKIWCEHCGAQYVYLKRRPLPFPPS